MTEGRARWWSKKDPGLVSSYRHTTIITTYRETISENNLKTSRKDFPQVNIKMKSHIEMGRRGIDAFLAVTHSPSSVTHR